MGLIEMRNCTPTSKNHIYSYEFLGVSPDKTEDLFVAQCASCDHSIILTLSEIIEQRKNKKNGT